MSIGTFDRIAMSVVSMAADSSDGRGGMPSMFETFEDPPAQIAQAGTNGATLYWRSSTWIGRFVVWMRPFKASVEAIYVGRYYGSLVIRMYG